MSCIDSLQFKKISYLFRSETVWNVLFIAKYQQCSAHQFLLLQKCMKFIFRIFQSQFIGTVYNPYYSISLFEIITPVRANGFLSSYVPNIKLVTLILQGFDIEAKCGGNLIDVFTIKFLDDCGFACIIETEYEQSHFLFLFFCFLDNGHETHLTIFIF